MRNIWIIAFWFACFQSHGLLTVCAQDVSANDTSAVAQDKQDSMQKSELQPSRPRYCLQAGDTLEISFKITPEFNQTITIQPDGFISLIDLEDIHVAGKTIPKLLETLQDKYSRILKAPIITIVLKEHQKPYFIANGELNRPGKYEFEGDITVLEALAMAGGINEKSKHSQVLLFRQDSGNRTSVKKLNIKKMVGQQDLSEDLHLRPGDMIYVPQNAISKIRTWIPIPNVGIYGAPF